MQQEVQLLQSAFDRDWNSKFAVLLPGSTPNPKPQTPNPHGEGDAQGSGCVCRRVYMFNACSMDFDLKSAESLVGNRQVAGTDNPRHALCAGGAW
jgi:hypothetical protein